MGRTAIIYGATDGRAGGVDRFGGGALEKEEAWVGGSSLGLAQTGGALPQAAIDDETQACKGQTSAESELIFPPLWRELPLAERQRFGHCFSFLVLKALGCQACVEEVQS